MTQALYAHMNNKTIKKTIIKKRAGRVAQAVGPSSNASTRKKKKSK
jgi:hypothetical protein